MLSCVSCTWYRFDERRQSLEPGFPRLIAEDFPGVNSKVDAVFEAFGKTISILLAIVHLKCFPISDKVRSLKRLLIIWFSKPVPYPKFQLTYICTNYRIS